MLRFLPLAALALVASGCSSSVANLASSAPPSSLVIDGDDRDWVGTLRPVEKQPGLSLGIRNDGDAMYIALTANTPEQTLRLARGVTFWFDGEGGKDRALGVGFPAPAAGGGRGEGGGLGGGEGPDRGAMQTRARERFEANARRMSLTVDGAEQRVGVTEVPGVQPAARWTDAGLTLELRVPIGADASGVSVAASGAVVGFGIEMVDAVAGPRARPQGGAGRGGRGGAGVGAGRGGTGGGRPGGRDGGGAREITTTTSWFRVTLAP